MEQSEVGKIFDWLDEWADGDIVSLSEKMKHAPAEQARDMVEQWPIFAHELPKVDPGELRPLISFRRGEDAVVSTALRLLLYTERVVVDSEFLHPHRAESRSLGNSGGWYVPVDLADYLRTLANLRPLIEDGSLLFTDRHDRNRGFDRGILDSYFSAAERVADTEWDDEEWPASRGFPVSTSIIVNLAADLFTILDGRATAVALTHNERLAFEAVIRSTDARPTDLSKLASFSVPDYQLNARELIALRSQSTALREFRASLRGALREVSSIPQTENATKEAQAIVAGALGKEFEAVNEESRKSPFLCTFKSAARRLGLTGVGAATGAATLGTLGMPLAGALAGVATGTAINVVESAREYSDHAKQRRNSRAIRDVVLSFLDETSS